MTAPKANPFKFFAFVLGEAVIAALLVATLSVALFYQLIWALILAPLLALAGFIAIIAYAKRNARLSTIVIFACPAAYTAGLLAAGLASGEIINPDLVAVGLFFALGVALFWAHFALNKYVR